MAKTHDDLELLERLWAAPAAPAAPDPAPAAPSPPRRLDDPVPARFAYLTLVAWALLYGLAVLVQPEADNPAAVSTIVEDGALFAFDLALLSALAGLASRRRWGFAGSLLASVGLLGLALACPATGHHVVGTWWYTQLGCAAGLIGLSAVGLHRR